MAEAPTARRLRAVHRQVIPRAVQKVVESLLAKRKGGRPHYHERQIAIRRALRLAHSCETIDELSAEILDDDGQTLLEETSRAFVRAVGYARDGVLEGALEDGTLPVARQVLALWDQRMNSSDDPVPANLPPLPPGLPTD